MLPETTKFFLGVGRMYGERGEMAAGMQQQCHTWGDSVDSLHRERERDSCQQRWHLLTLTIISLRSQTRSHTSVSASARHRCATHKITSQITTTDFNDTNPKHLYSRNHKIFNQPRKNATTTNALQHLAGRGTINPFVTSLSISTLVCLRGSLAQCALSLKRLSAGPGFNPQTRQNKLFQDYFEINFSDRQQGLTVFSIICDR